jgi:RNA polymerase sigma-70 factor, ECF subfamily
LAHRIHALRECDLVPLAIAGNDAAFTRLYRRHAGWVAGALVRMVGGEFDLDTVMASTFIEARRDLVRLREPEHLRGWLTAIALRSFVEHAKKSEPEVELEDLVWRSPPAVWGAAASVVSQFGAAVRALPPRVRVPFVLQRLGETPTIATAELTGLSVREIRRRVWSADKKLRSQNLAVMAQRVRMDVDEGWHDLREMRVLKTVRAAPVVRTGFAAIHEERARAADPTLRDTVIRYGALAACSAAVVGFGAWLGPLLRTITG